MANLRKYEVSLNYDTNVIIEIDHDVFTPELQNQINRFWGDEIDQQYRISAAGSMLNAVLKTVAKFVLIASVNSFCVINKFELEAPEGLPKLDGSFGIKIISYDEWSIDDDDLNVSEV